MIPPNIYFNIFHRKFKIKRKICKVLFRKPKFQFTEQKTIEKEG